MRLGDTEDGGSPVGESRVWASDPRRGRRPADPNGGATPSLAGTPILPCRDFWERTGTDVAALVIAAIVGEDPAPDFLVVGFDAGILDVQSRSAPGAPLTGLPGGTPWNAVERDGVERVGTGRNAFVGDAGREASSPRERRNDDHG